MKKIFITGATASQYSVDAHSRSTRFSGLLNSALISEGINSVVGVPSIEVTQDEIKEYDSVVVGLSPISSLSANRIYAAIHTLGISLDAGNGKILLDAPDPNMVFKSFRSVLANPSLLTKETYSSRYDYKSVVSDPKVRNRLMETIDIVANEGLPTIVPALPYFNPTRDDYGIPSSGEYKDLISINLESFSKSKNIVDSNNHKYWSSESHSSPWSKKIEKTLSKPVLPLKRSAYDTDFEYEERLKNSIGLLISVHKNNLPWWSPNILLALTNGIPVFSDWRYTEVMGSSWRNLPSDAESMSPAQRLDLASSQLESYLTFVDNCENNIKIQLAKLFINL